MMKTWRKCRLAGFAVIVAGLVSCNCDAITKRCYYEVLGVDKGATSQVIKKAYRKLSLKYHPDRSKGKDYSVLYREINEAYEILSNQDKRDVYDIHGHQGFDEGNESGSYSSPFDLIADLFGGRQNRQRERSKHSPIKFPILLTLEQVYKGTNFSVEFNRPVTCPRASECIANRPDCQGPGMRIVTQQLGPGFIVQNQVNDPSCLDQGKGWKKHCHACPNGLTQLETAFVTAIVPPGIREGSEIVIAGKGIQSPINEPGDLIFTVETLLHERFRREHANLHSSITVDLPDALCGFRVELEHLDGSFVIINSDRVVRDREILTYRDKGMPSPAGFKGDLFVEIRYRYPERLDRSEKESMRAALSNVKYVDVK